MFVKLEKTYINLVIFILSNSKSNKNIRICFLDEYMFFTFKLFILRKMCICFLFNLKIGWLQVWRNKIRHLTSAAYWSTCPHHHSPEPNIQAQGRQCWNSIGIRHQKGIYMLRTLKVLEVKFPNMLYVFMKEIILKSI